MIENNAQAAFYFKKLLSFVLHVFVPLFCVMPGLMTALSLFIDSVLRVFDFLFGYFSYFVLTG